LINFVTMCSTYFWPALVQPSKFNYFCLGK
jgi:hypothetical protein